MPLLMVVGLVFAGPVLVAGWYFSSVLLRPVRELDHPDRVVAVRDGQVWLRRSRWAAQPGEWGLRWPAPDPGGHESGGSGSGSGDPGPGGSGGPGSGGGRVAGWGAAGPAGSPIGSGSIGSEEVRGDDGVAGIGPVLAGGAAADPDVLRRPLLPGSPAPAVGPVALDAGRFGPDPAAVGLAFEMVTVSTPVGACPAWWVPGRSSTWVIAVHGRGAERRECLRVLPVLHGLGHPVLAVSYRNDVDAPAGPDGHYHLGDTEWHDLAAAVDHAAAAGATGVVLYGWSMGAAIIGAYLDRGALDPGRPPVRAVVWDSPVVDWRATLRLQAAQRRLPPWFTAVATWVTSRRTGIDFDRFDLAAHPPACRPPTLLFHGDADTAVPVEASRALAGAAARLDWPLNYREVPGAEHTAPWNVDPAAYRAAVATFLTEHAP